MEQHRLISKRGRPRPSRGRPITAFTLASGRHATRRSVRSKAEFWISSVERAAAHRDDTKSRRCDCGHSNSPDRADRPEPTRPRPRRRQPPLPRVRQPERPLRRPTRFQPTAEASRTPPPKDTSKGPAQFFSFFAPNCPVESSAQARSQRAGSRKVHNLTIQMSGQPQSCRYCVDPRKRRLRLQLTAASRRRGRFRPDCRRSREPLSSRLSIFGLNVPDSLRMRGDVGFGIR